MSNFYKIIENQVNIILRFVLSEDDKGELQYGSWVSGPRWVQLFVQVLTLLLFLTIVSIFGVYLWNNGISAVFPNVVQPLGVPPSEIKQRDNPYLQLIITLFALMMFFK